MFVLELQRLGEPRVLIEECPLRLGEETSCWVFVSEMFCSPVLFGLSLVPRLIHHEAGGGLNVTVGVGKSPVSSEGEEETASFRLPFPVKPPAAIEEGVDDVVDAMVVEDCEAIKLKTDN